MKEKEETDRDYTYSQMAELFETLGIKANWYMKKLLMQIHNIVDENIKKITELFPNRLTKQIVVDDESKASAPNWDTWKKSPIGKTA